MVLQPTELLEKGIIEVRRAYEAGELPDGQEPLPPPDDKVVRGFKRLLTSIEAHLGSGDRLEPATADTLLARVLGDDRLLELLRTSALRIPAVLGATPNEERDEAAEHLGVGIA